MDENSLIWWIVQFIVTFLEFVKVYMLTHAILKRRIKFNSKHIAIMLLFTGFVAPIAYVDGYIFQIVINIVMLLVMKYFSKRTLGDVVIIYGLILVVFVFNEAPVFFVMTLLNNLFDIYEPFLFLIGQLLATFGITFVCLKLKPNRWFYTLQINVVLRLVLFVAALILLIIIFLLNFEFNIFQTLFFTTTIIGIGIVTYPIVLNLYHNTIGIISVHDLINCLLSVAYAIFNLDDPKKIKEIFNEFLRDIGLDFGQLDIKDGMGQLQANNEKIKSFIKRKQKGHKMSKEIISDIDYLEDCDTVGLYLALKWLGTLLDNALEASASNPIFVQLISTEDVFTLNVANEYLGEKGQDIKNIFERGYSTKGSGRGIGLHNLSTAVTKLEGTVDAEEYYMEEYNCHYLQISIKFKHDSLLRN